MRCCEPDCNVGGQVKKVVMWAGRDAAESVEWNGPSDALAATPLVSSVSSPKRDQAQASCNGERRPISAKIGVTVCLVRNRAPRRQSSALPSRDTVHVKLTMLTARPITTVTIAPAIAQLRSNAMSKDRHSGHAYIGSVAATTAARRPPRTPPGRKSGSQRKPRLSAMRSRIGSPCQSRAWR